MIIGHNVLGNSAYRILKGINSKNIKTLKRLALGQRITSAGDDAAGLAISEGMRARIRGLKQSTRNAQDAYSLTQTMDGVLNEISLCVAKNEGTHCPIFK